MELDPEEVFRDDDEDPDSDDFWERNTTKELAVYLVDASPKMFSTRCLSDDEKEESHFHIAMMCILESLKSQIINRSYDEVAVCFFNTRERKNLQDLSGVYVFDVADKESLDRPTAKFIKELGNLEDAFVKQIGSQYGIVAETRENSLYNALWVAQALLRKGSVKTADKRILIFTNEDDPFQNMKGGTKADMTRTTIQRAKDARDMGIGIDLLPLSPPEREFSLSNLYADLLGLEGNDLAQFMPAAVERMEEMRDQLRKRMFKKRIVKKLMFTIADGLSIEVNAYALVRQTAPGSITWLDSVTNLPLKVERSFICGDTGALIKETPKRFQNYKNLDIMFTVEELSQLKWVGTQQLRLLGFKPLSCLRDYHNLRPSTFVFPSDEEVIGSTQVFVALHRSMVQLKRFAVAFYSNPLHPRLVALIAQEEIADAIGQHEPPGMHMIYLPYSDDIRQIEELHSHPNITAPRASDDQVGKAAALVRRINLLDFSVGQFLNPALQRHYAVLQALALQEDELPEMEDGTLPDEEGLARPGVVKAIDEFKLSVYGGNYMENASGQGKMTEASKKRKTLMDNAVRESAKYNWADLANRGKIRDLTVVDLKRYLTVHSLPVSGKKEDLILRILTHLGK
ncbi:hypothetical protein MLD38_002293 [Melastoma candidum]|uniref:Uncharacterized protein n=1 Tax=Melastoma candidum TaxID=119954 RepID=A0ACB9SFD0_9MYRT|nr:hypothetical protein MLD38_002293 [Melastoma candidum]